MIGTSPAVGYSADVEIELLMNGRRFSVGQVGRDVLIFDEPVSLPATEGELVLTIDGRSRRWSVSLHAGQQPSRTIAANLRDIE